MALDHVWAVLESLLDGATVAGTLATYEPVETEHGVPVVVRVQYREVGSVDSERLDAEIQAFGYTRSTVVGDTIEYEVPRSRGSDVIPAFVGFQKQAPQQIPIDDTTTLIQQ